MPVAEARRGRPKGSGLDDNVHLQEIIRRLADDPALKPTTAIKLIGINDPSTIRRLRDKLKSFKGEGTASNGHESGEGSSRARPPTKPSSISAAPRSEKRSPAQAAELAGPRQGDGSGALACAVSASDETFSWFASWCGLGLQAISTTVEAQIAAMETILRVPPIASVLRQQVLINEHVMAFYALRPSVRSTLH